MSVDFVIVTGNAGGFNGDTAYDDEAEVDGEAELDATTVDGPPMPKAIFGRLAGIGVPVTVAVRKGEG